MPKFDLNKAKPNALGGFIKGEMTKPTFNGPTYKPPHLIIVARAGTGKTTTLISSIKVLRGIDPGIDPSPQQKAVWDAVNLSRKSWSKFICMVSFTNTIVSELRERVPPGVDVKTTHGMGFGAVRKAFDILPGDAGIDPKRVQKILVEITGKDIRTWRKEKPTYVRAVEEIVSLCKQNLIDPYTMIHPETDEEEDDSWFRIMMELALKYEVEIAGIEADVASVVPLILERCKDVDKDRYIDHDDMIWLPVVLNLPMFTFDILFIDEGQDLNRCQQELLCRVGRRIILCGDDAQAIYAFAGADSESIPRMMTRLKNTPQGCEMLKLTVTRRCGKTIVQVAKGLVPDFEAHEGNPDGTVGRMNYPIQPGRYGAENIELPVGQTYLPAVNVGDMIICRANAPLVNQFFRFVKLKKPAKIIGRNIGQGLIDLITRLEPVDIMDLMKKITLWRNEEIQRETGKENPSDKIIENIMDRNDCIMMFAGESQDVRGVLNRIDEVFTKTAGENVIRMMTIHKAKGLEADRVFYLDAAVFPRTRRAIPEWQRIQEQNMRYVGITRAKSELVWVI